MIQTRHRHWVGRVGFESALANMSPVGYIHIMIEVRQTRAFVDWFSGLRDRQAKARIAVRIDRLALEQNAFRLNQNAWLLCFCLVAFSNRITGIHFSKKTL